MESLATIINSLSAGELKLIRHFYKLKDFGEYRKRVQLFDIITKQKIYNNQEVAKILGYTKANNSSFQHLKSRLKSDVLCMLLMQECSAKFSTPYAQAKFECRRNLMQGEILISRGVYEEALDQLDKAARIAAKFELFAEGLLIEDIRRNHIAQKGNRNDFEEITSSMEENFVRLGREMIAKRNHYEITTPQFLSVNSFEEYNTKGKERIHDLFSIRNSQDSSRTKFYQHLTSISYYSSIHDFESAQLHAIDLLKTVETDKVVKSNSNQAGVNMELANIYLNTGNFEKAISHSQHAVELFKSGMINQLHAYIILFFSFFRSNDLRNASRILALANQHRLIKNQKDPLMVSRLQLLRAAVSFKEGDYDASSFILRENSELLRDKDGWMPGYFLLESLTLLEKKSVDLANYRIEAFRKMIGRNNFRDEQRIGAITRILKQLARDEWNYKKLVPEKNKDIKMLSEAKEKFYWNPAGYEIIRFDEWLLQKVS
jgi:tetratricopeptide (TPR) repeat protein